MIARHSNHLSVHEWVRSAIHYSQQPTSPSLFLKLPPPACAVLLVYHENSWNILLAFFVSRFSSNATFLAKSYPYSKADHIPCENSSGNLGKNDWPLMVKIKFCDPCQARLFSCHVLSCPRARVQPQVRSCESMASQIIFLDRICRRVFFINRSGRSGHWGEGLKANRELGQVWKITLPLEPK